MVGFEKALRTVKVIKDQIQYRSQSLLNLTRGYFIKPCFHYTANANKAIIKPGLHISRKDRKHRLENMSFKLSSCGLASVW